MFLTSEIPTNWRDLQDKVCKYLVQAGYHEDARGTGLWHQLKQRV